MRSALIISSIAFIVVELGILYSTFALDFYWPDPAVDYWEWQAVQPLNDVVAVLPYISLAFVVVSLLSASALIFGISVARWPFVITIAMMLAIEVVVALNVPPQLVGINYLLNEFALLFAGIVGALAFCVAHRRGASAP